MAELFTENGNLSTVYGKLMWKKSARGRWWCFCTVRTLWKSPMRSRSETRWIRCRSAGW